MAISIVARPVGRAFTRRLIHFCAAVFLLVLVGMPAMAQEPPPANLHMIDVQDGQAVLLDMGEFELLFDGGSHRAPRGSGTNHLAEYLSRPGLIDGPLDLLIISDSHTQAYEGAQRTFFPVSDAPPIAVKEVWTPGSPDEWPNSSCEQTSLRFAELIRTIRDRGIDLKSPLQNAIRPLMGKDGKAEWFALQGNPAIKAMLVNSGLENAGRNELICAFAPNNGAIVLGLEIYGVRILLAGDIETGFRPGREDIRRPRREDEIVRKVSDIPWFRKIEILLAPRKGGPSASSPGFVGLVSPRYVLMGSQPQFNYPDRDVFERYQESGSRVLTTAGSREGGKHNIVCSWTGLDDLKCVFGSIDEERVAQWEGSLVGGEPLKESRLGEILGEAEETVRGGGKALFGSPRRGLNTELKGATLYGLELSEADLSRFDLTGADLSFASLPGAKFVGSILTETKFDYAYLPEADFAEAVLENVNARQLKAPGITLSQAQIIGSSFEESDFSGAILFRTELKSVGLRDVRLDGAQFEPTNFSLAESAGSLKRVENVDDIANLQTLHFESNPSALKKLRKYLADAGLRSKAADITYAIESSRQGRAGWAEWGLRYVFFDLTTEYGRAPNRPLLIMLGLIPVFALFYAVAILRRAGAGLFAVQAKGDGPSILPIEGARRIHYRDWRAAAGALYFAFLSAFHFGWRDINVGTWMQKLSPVQFNIDATGWVRSISGAQSLISFYLIVMWALMFFGDPFQ